MITIKNKKDAVNKIKILGLNYFPMEIFDAKDLTSIKNFFDKNPAQEYILRNPNKPKAKYYFVKNYDEAVNKLRYFDEVNINVSFNPYKDDLVLVGDIKIHKGDFGDTVDLIARTDNEATQRNIYTEPDYNLHANLDDDKLWDIPGFSKIARYISDHELYDVIVEFCVYSIKLGVQKDFVIINELRTGF